ncbi:hypothetical protein LUZ60_017349 [Juncus effusus]|nr:hypothetical protein LUZ60_017349 [Juncus effusus]
MSSSNNSDSPGPRPSRYESQKRRDWNTFRQYLRNHRPPLELSRCSGAHVLEFLRYLDQFGKTKVHNSGCPFFGHPTPPGPCPCPLRQAWGSLDALIGRLRAAFEEDGGKPEANPFGARAVRLYLREIRDSQAKARGILYEKKRRKRPPVAKNVQNDHVQIVPNDHHHVQNSENENCVGDLNLVISGGVNGNYLHHHDFMMMHHDSGMMDGGDESSHAAAAGCMLPLSVFN